MKSLSQYLLETDEENTEEQVSQEPETKIDNDTAEPEKDDEDVKSNDKDTINMNGFVVLKPGALEKESELRSALEEQGWEIVGEQEKKLTRENVEKIYSDKANEPYFEDLIEYMTSDKSKCLMLWKEDSKDPIGEIKTIKEKLRQEWMEDESEEMKNFIHSSDSFDNMEKELSEFLKEEPENDEKSEDSEEESEASGSEEKSDSEETSDDDNNEEEDENEETESF